MNPRRIFDGAMMEICVSIWMNYNDKSSIFEMPQELDARRERILATYRYVGEIRILNPLTDHSIIIQRLFSEVTGFVSDEERRVQSILSEVDLLLDSHHINDDRIISYLDEIRVTRARLRTIVRMVILFDRGN